MTTAAAARRSARALVVGPGARRALREGARGAVELAFGPGGYVRLGEHHVLLAPARSPAGPLSVLVAGLRRGELVAGEPAYVSSGALVAGSLRIELGGAREPRPLHPGRPSPDWVPALAAALAVAPPAPPELAPGLAALAAGDLAAAVDRLAGRGDGLTPAGDDVLAGFAAWRWACGAPLALAADRCAPLGREYLRCAERGELPRPAAAVLTAIRGGDRRAAARGASRLTEWGASSGAALLWGIAAGATAHIKRETPARGRPGSRREDAPGARTPGGAHVTYEASDAELSPSIVRGSPPPTAI